MGAEYYSTGPRLYRSGRNEQVMLTHATETIATTLNTFAPAELHPERAAEPQRRPEQRQRFPHQQSWLDAYLGVIFFFLLRATAD